MGDLSSDIFKVCSDSRVVNYNLQLVSYCLLPTISRATRLTNTNASHIDNTWTSYSETVLRSGIVSCDISIHYPNFRLISLNGSAYNRPQVHTYKKKIVNQTCRDDFIEKLGSLIGTT